MIGASRTSALTLCVVLGFHAVSVCEAFNASWVLDDARKAQMEAIVVSNADRRSAARIVSAFVYLFVALGMMSMAGGTSMLLGWLWRPFPCLRKSYHGQSMVWFAISMVLIFAVSAAGGLPGWMLIGFLFFATFIALLVVVCCATHKARKSLVVPIPLPRVTEALTVRSASQDSLGGGDIEADVFKKDVDAEKKSAPPSWQFYPLPLGRMQAAILAGCSLAMIIFMLIDLILVYSWSVQDYTIWDVKEQAPLVEFIPSNVAKTLTLMYSWDSLATNLRLQIYVQLFTSHCESSFHKTLEDSEKAIILDDWINKYGIDMRIYTPEDYRGYASINDWFIRRINPVHRPVIVDSWNRAIVSPADCRMLMFPTRDNSAVWIKGKHFSYSELLNNEEQWINQFQGGQMVIARLAPQDYHRFNTPIEGRIIYHKSVDGSLWSVSADAATSENYAFYNQRQLVVLENDVYGMVAYVAIGATCTGSVIINKEVGSRVHLGDEIGYMQFGGSTIVMLFQKDKVVLDPEILEYSRYPVESYVQINRYIGTF